MPITNRNFYNQDYRGRTLLEQKLPQQMVSAMLAEGNILEIFNFGGREIH
jgi:hypothetical protein